jgi:acylphosphatase
VPEIRRRVIISGLVQGVNFRSTTRDRAQSLGLTGWVRNRAGGSVEAVFEGDDASVQQMVAWCRRGPPCAQVFDVRVVSEPFQSECSDFRIRYDSWE